MDRWYELLEPIQGVQAQNGTTQIVHLPAGISVKLVQPQRYQNVAEVEYKGAVVVVFYDTLCCRSQICKDTANRW